MLQDDIRLYLEMVEYSTRFGNTSLAHEEMKRVSKKIKEQILAAHLEKYKIYFCKSDNKYHSKLPDPAKQDKRKSVAHKSKEELETIIVDFYLKQYQEKDKPDIQEITLESQYPLWMKYKTMETGNSNYMKRIDDDWKRYYLNDPIIKKSLLSMRTIDLKEWAQKKIVSCNLTKKQYINMSIIIRQVYDYLVEQEILKENPYRQFKINKKLYACPTKKKPATEVFNEEEEKLAKEYLFNAYLTNPELTTPLAILLNFYLGLRAGELVALKNGDISPDGKYIHIQWMQIREFTQNKDGKWLQKYVIVHHTKTDAGDRELYLVPDARKIIALVQQANKKAGLPCGDDDLLFYNRDGNALRPWTLEKVYRQTCEKLGIVRKSNHKVRKTCLTKLGDNPNINLKDAMQFAGHKDVQVFIENYCFSRYSKEKTEAELEKTLCG